MSKCHVRELSKVYAALFRDATYAYPTLGGEFERDLERLLGSVKQRGIHLFVVDLPAMGKHLDKCLAAGKYTLSGLPLTKRVSGRVVIPSFLRGLYLLVFEPDGRLKEDCDIEAVFFLRQILYVAKKTQLPCSQKAVDDEVVDFFLVDRHLPQQELFWDDVTPSYETIESLFAGFSKSKLYQNRVRMVENAEDRMDLSTFLVKLEQIAGLITSSLGAYRHRDWKFRHGPGAVAERTGSFNKYCWTNWSERLESVYPLADCGFHNLAAWAGSVATGEIDKVGSKDPPSRLLSVPKTYTKPRLIAAEPSEHQWCQQNLRDYFCTQVEESWISGFVRFRDQTRNQELCLRGSIDGSLATVDLSAASDRVTCHAVGQLFRVNPRLVLALQASRTRSVVQNLVRAAPATVQLRKFSTMGSACTFPVESLLFLAITLAAVLTKRQRKVTLREVQHLTEEVAIYGDDIIVPVDSRELLFRAFEVLDFKVNTDKSHWTGMFRESCGVDSFAGVNVTPAYWKSPCDGKPESLASTVEVSNNFHSRFLLATSWCVASTARKEARFRLPFVGMDSGVFGFRSFVAPLISSFKTRVSETLHRIEAFVPRILTRQRKTAIEDDSALLQYFTEDPPPHCMWEGGVPQRPSLKIKLGWVPTDELEAQQDVKLG